MAKRQNQTPRDPLTDYKRVIHCLDSRYKSKVYLCKEDKFIFENLCKIFTNLQSPPERPDACAFFDNTLYLLEHFEFDNSDIVEKTQLNGNVVQVGSRQTCTMGHNEKEFGKKLSPFNPVIIEKESVERNGHYYVKNLLTQFYKHAEKIPEYKKCFEGSPLKIQQIKIGFIIEDVSLFGSRFYGERDGIQGLYEVCPIFSKEMLDAFEQTQELDFIITTPKANRTDGVMGFASRQAIPVLRHLEYCVENIGWFQYQDNYLMMQDVYFKKVDQDGNMVILDKLG